MRWVLAGVKFLPPVSDETVLGIIRVCSGIKVGRITTRRIIAMMARNQVLGIDAGQPEGESVCPYKPSPEFESPISFGGAMGFPLPAFAIGTLFYLLPKARLFLFGYFGNVD